MSYENPLSSTALDRLDTAVNLGFECSLLAAETSQAAHDFFEKRQNMPREDGRFSPCLKTLYMVGNEGGRPESKILRLSHFDASETMERPVNLALAEVTMPVTKEVVTRRFFRKHVKAAVTYEPAPLALCALFGDVALPLATFNRRKDGACSYIQIGSEIDEDHLMVTASDETTGRQQIVQAVKALIEAEQPGEKLDSHHNKALHALIASEQERNKEGLMTAFEARLVRECIPENRSAKQAHILEKGQDTALAQTLHVKEILERTWMNDHPVSLVAGSTAESSTLRLYAVSRGSVYTPLAFLDPSTGRVTFKNPELEADRDAKSTLVNKLLVALGGGSLARQEDLDLRSFSAGNDLERGVINVLEDEHFAPFIKGVGTPCVMVGLGPVGTNELYNYFYNPLTAPNPHPESKVVSAIVDRLLAENEARKDVLQSLNYRKVLPEEARLNPAEELALESLYRAACQSDAYEGTLSHGKESRFDAHIKIQFAHGQCSITFTGKPSAMDEAPRRLELLSIDFDPTCALAEEEKNKLIDILNLLHQLKPLPNSLQSPR